MAEGSPLIERTIELTISTQEAGMPQKQGMLTQTARVWQGADPSSYPSFVNCALSRT